MINSNTIQKGMVNSEVSQMVNSSDYNLMGNGDISDG